MAIAILGASGQIGARLAQYCLQNNIDARFLVRSVDPRLARWDSNNIIKVDVTDRVKLKEALTGCTAIINSAIDQSSTTDEQELTERNKRFFTSLIEIAIELKIEKIVEISSIAVLPPKVTKEVLQSDYNYSTETDWYTTVKIEIEKLALGYKDKVDITVIRPGVVYGPYINWSKLAFLRTINKNCVVPDVLSVCHAIHVDDLAALMLFCANKNNKTPLIVYGINPELVSWQDFYDYHGKAASVNLKTTVRMPIAEIKLLLSVGGDELRRPSFKRKILDLARSLYGFIPAFIIKSDFVKKLRKKLKAINYGLLNYDSYLNPPKGISNPNHLPNEFELELYQTNAMPSDDKNGVQQGFEYSVSLKQGAEQAARWWKFRL